MNRILMTLPALLIAATTSAMAQEAPEGAYRDLWCGLAFGTAATEAPNSPPEELAAARAAGDAATEEQKGMIAQDDMIQQFVTGGQSLVDRANTAYTGAGFSAEQFGTVRTDLEPQVLAQVRGDAGAEAEFSFEECSGLLPQADAMGGAMTEGDAMAPAEGEAVTQ